MMKSKTTFIFKEGDRVWFESKKYIVGGRYYPDGYRNIKSPAYTIYPPGSKKTYSKHFWVLETMLRQR